MMRVPGLWKKLENVPAPSGLNRAYKEEMRETMGNGILRLNEIRDCLANSRERNLYSLFYLYGSCARGGGNAIFSNKLCFLFRS